METISSTIIPSFPCRISLWDNGAGDGSEKNSILCRNLQEYDKAVTDHATWSLTCSGSMWEPGYVEYDLRPEDKAAITSRPENFPCVVRFSSQFVVELVAGFNTAEEFDAKLKEREQYDYEASATVNGGSAYNTVTWEVVSVAMLNTSILTAYGAYEYYPLSLESSRSLAIGASSAIGHQSTADIMSELLGVPVAMNRINYEQKPGALGLVFKLNGRPEEGKILSREDIEKIGYSFGLLIRQS